MTQCSPVQAAFFLVKSISIGTGINNTASVFSWYQINTKICSITQHCFCVSWLTKTHMSYN